MTWTGPTDAPVSARIAALAPSLHRSERRVVDLIAGDLAAAVECTAQELAQRVGVGRASVIRTAQTLGYDGYPQMRVAMARELAVAPADAPSDDTDVGALRAAIDRFGQGLPHLTAALTDEAVEGFLAALDEAERVVVVATGLSAPLGLNAAMRLTSVGRPAEYIPDTHAQLIASDSLSPGSACLVISGSGINRASLDCVAAARAAGAKVVALTSFARSPLVDEADVALVIPPADNSFADELLHTSRAALALVTETVVDLLVARRGERGTAARAAKLPLIGKRLSE